MEMAVSMALVAAGFTLFGLAVKYLPVFPREELPALEPVAVGAGGLPRPALTRPALLALWSLLLFGFAAVMYSSQRSVVALEKPAGSGPATPVPALLRLPPPYTFPVSADSPGPVTFDHSAHVDRGAPRCTPCHVDRFRLDAPGQPVGGALSHERIHEGDLCASCHNGSTAFAVDDCESCHRK
jgi:c(7)-type cytochrome triheme protein